MKLRSEMGKKSVAKSFFELLRDLEHQRRKRQLKQVFARRPRPAKVRHEEPDEKEWK